MSWLVEKYCAKCDKQLTVREAASHNKHPDFTGEVCYGCFQAWRQANPGKSDPMSPELHQLLMRARKGRV